MEVSCLSEFKNLERLELGFNNMTSFEGLKLCINLKWLSVVQNKLQSLKGNEGLTVLTCNNFISRWLFWIASLLFGSWLEMYRIVGGHSPSSEAPNLYRLCIVFVAFSCIGYAIPFILCTIIYCCLPCIISVLGFREDFSHNRGATQESINSLPIYNFKIKKNKSDSDKETGEGGIVAAGTEKEHAISGEDERQGSSKIQIKKIEVRDEDDANNNDLKIDCNFSSAVCSSGERQSQ